jgi:hypothetical protein
MNDCRLRTLSDTDLNTPMRLLIEDVLLVKVSRSLDHESVGILSTGGK